MRCCDCNLWWQDEGENFCYCHADPNWPAPCECGRMIMMKNDYIVLYKHTFIADVFENVTENEAKERAIRYLKEDFPDDAFPLKGCDNGKDFIAYKHEDLIDCIEIYEESDYEEEE